MVQVSIDAPCASICWPSAPSLIHVDQRQRDLRWSGNVMNSYSRGPTSFDRFSRISHENIAEAGHLGHAQPRLPPRRVSNHGESLRRTTWVPTDNVVVHRRKMRGERISSVGNYQKWAGPTAMGKSVVNCRPLGRNG